VLLAGDIASAAVTASGSAGLTDVLIRNATEVLGLERRDEAHVTLL
jgi:hypothetical protein